MLIIVTEDIYNEVLARYGEEYVGMDEDGNFCIDIVELIYDEKAYEGDGGYYIVSLRPSEKEIFVPSGI